MRLYDSRVSGNCYKVRLLLVRLGVGCEQWHAGGHRALAAMESRLATRTFLVGERCSVADVSPYADTHVAHEAG
ncbi:MAG TPA: glutathione binding-like protein, partial [Gaiellaceae bacterium]|nr:glutathione binding-like protein [Gaiellaceae bacterium]